jgi:hypothetical protein
VRKNDHLIVKAYKEWNLLDTTDWGSSVAVTFSLKQVLKEQNSTDELLSQLDEEKCRSTLKHFRNLLNRSVYPNRNGRDGRRLRVISVVEEGDGRWHAHAAIECPDHLSVEEFKPQIQNCWSKCHWSHGLYIQTAFDARGWTNYMLKLRQKSGLETWGDAIDLDTTYNPHVVKADPSGTFIH